mmetsp:Transcript_14456/g.35001  ORF Transcript_14456/g.35001 Transcript_14456/m.35001 type:complete len:153 (-) Transcript_14456:5776-6234(-)
MPVEFQNLCSLVHASQTVMRKACPPPPRWMCLHEWFSQRKLGSFDALSEASFRLHSKSEMPRIGTPGIRSYTKETGVFFPDSLSMDPLWQVSNPFDGGSRRESTLVFTEMLPKLSIDCKNDQKEEEEKRKEEEQREKKSSHVTAFSSNVAIK